MDLLLADKKNNKTSITWTFIYQIIVKKRNNHFQGFLFNNKSIGSVDSDIARP